ncbi:S8 family peptidase [Demequina aurantiaca]|uniref:S8 family peptidase n=1 Tax=Demequina aurantiaca TaxID=676200 RepID=UPI003D3396F0
MNSQFCRKRLPAVAALTIVGLLAAGLPASASIVDDGEWYMDLYEVPQFHDEGIDGSGVTIAVIDDAINSDVPALQGADVTVMPDSLCADSDGELLPVDTDDLELASHGTNIVLKIAGTGEGYPGQDGITGVAPGASVLFYGRGMDILEDCFTPGTGKKVFSENLVGPAIVDAVDRGARIVSLSFAAGYAGPLEDALAYAIRHQVIVLAATSNDTRQESSETLNLFNGVMGIGSLGPDGEAGTDSDGEPNATSFIDVVAPGQDVALQGADGAWDRQRIGSGTSYSTPITAANLALAMQHNPGATGNQILQLLLHNTDVDTPHEIYYDTMDYESGYGSVDTISLLADDALQYPDVNPLLTEDGTPSPAELTPEVTPSPTPSMSASTAPEATNSPSSTPSASPIDAGSSGTPGWLWPLIIVAVVLVAGSGIVAVVIASRRGKGTPS